MSRLPTKCPGCGEGLHVTRLDCPSCELHLEGRFDLPELIRLDADDLAFVLEFVRVSGSLKEMSALRSLSYPTIRNRLDDIIAKLETGRRVEEKAQHEILESLSKGKINAREAARLLKQVRK